ncbi:diaminopimelate decarboxylase [Wenjunlia vitaminophila]|uniref:Diaminopimelate decarboxylase n=1 Tax=Wenjunlia vitaminophila TaxID=76728 RepID=A0A0T6LR67_WENVI|nr:diaminopimelate decarboxylase [Wenjunlia vitaminophila]KRV48425.1 diaminopimelate decarboxylase [Wenjunlia vitaminophila]
MARRREAVVRGAVSAGLVGPRAPLAGFLDADGIRRSVADLQAAFADVPEVLHTFAVKAGSLVPVLRLLAERGMGCEVASPGELAQALAAGVPPGRIVLDSPAKTWNELAHALDLGVAVNADSLEELHRIDVLLDGATPRSTLGLRVNPQVGAGAIGAMSTATAHAKFGVALHDPGAVEQVVRAFATRPWLTRLHAHVGSQGCPLELIAAGLKETYDLAERINAELGRRQVTSLDIGGGLPVNFADDEVTPTFAEYVQHLRRAVPGLFTGAYALVTEFGRALLAKNGFLVSVVEYTKESGGRRIAVTHAGAQVATRTVFMPEAWPLRIGAFDPRGREKTAPDVVQDVAGPCCFAGDLVARGRELPELEPGDLVVLLDTGAYYMSTPFTYNSLARPPVYGFTTAGGGTADQVRFGTVREGQTLRSVVVESGLDQVEALVSLVPGPEGGPGTD